MPLAVDVVAGHRPGAIAGIGLVLALVGVGVASWERGGDRAASRAAEGTGLAIVAAVGFGLFFVGMDFAADSGVWWPVVIARSASLSTLCLVAFATRRSANVAPAARPAATAVGILEIGADMLFVAALGHGLAGFVSVFGSLYPLTTVLLAWLVLRERACACQGLGAAGALTGVVLLSLGG